MISIKDIKKAVEQEFTLFETSLSQATVSDHPILSPITKLILKPSGKHVRPLLVLLSARLHGPSLEESGAEGWRAAISAAVLLEMIHWSTLVHDDVIDEAYQRRGEWTPSALLRSKSAVLIGDYLFSKGLSTATRAQNMYAVSRATITIESLVEGELKQMAHARKRNTTRADYFDIIDHKTASLISAATECGAQAGGASPQQIERLKQFGLLLGQAFQIQDDILDYGKPSGRLDDKTTGKVALNDLREGKITLPLIYAMDSSTPTLRKEAMKALPKAASDARKLQWLKDFVFQNDGITKCRTELNDLICRAIDMLDVYPDSQAKQSLILLCRYVGDRQI